MNTRTPVFYAALLLSACGAGASEHANAGSITIDPTPTLFATATSRPPDGAPAASVPPGSLPSVVTNAPLPARALVISSDRVSELDLSTGQVGRTLFEGPAGPVVPIRGTTDLLVVSGGKILRLANGKPNEVIAAGTQASISPDGKLLASLEFDQNGGPAISLVIRTFTTGVEKRWPLGPDARGISAPTWSADSTHVYFNFGDEGYGELLQLNVALPVSDLTTTASPIRTGLGDNEGFGLARAVNDGAFVHIMCKIDGRFTSFSPPCGYGILTSTGLRRIGTIEANRSITAIDPSGQVVVFSEGPRRYASMIDGSLKREVRVAGHIVLY